VPAFTLLEVLVATVLATLLMVGVLAVVADLGASGVVAPAKARPEAALGPEAADAWVRLLREDLNHASAVHAADENEMTLVGYAALDTPARERTHRPVRVLYRIQEVRGRRWIIRRQEALDVLTNENVQQDLVCCGVSRFELKGSEYAAEHASGTAPGEASGPGPAAAMPAKTEGGRAAAGGRWENRAYVNHRWFVRDDTGAHTRLPPLETALINDRWYVSEDSHALDQAVQEQRGPEASPAAAPEGGREPQRQSAGMVWRLRLWTDDRDEPAHDRIVTVPSGGGP
jgi:hypothetical protein